MADWFMPTPDEWELAAEHAPGTVTVKATPVRDLVPGDRYAARGRVHTVTDWPSVYEALGSVCVPVEEARIDPEYVLRRHVAAWPGRTVNYGLRRCPTCGCHVPRDHQPGNTECELLQAERLAKMEDL